MNAMEMPAVTADMQSANDDAEPALVLDFMAIRSAVYRSRYWIAAILGGALLIGAAITLFMTPYYAASATVQIDQNASKVVGTEDTETAVNAQDAERFLNTQLGILQSRTLAALVARDLNLYTSEELVDWFNIKLKDDLEENEARKQRELAVVETLVKNLEVTLPTQSRIATITFESPNAEFSARVANSYAKNFILNNLQRKVDTSAYAREFLAKQLADVRERLAASEAAANRYSEGAQIIRPGGGVEDRQPQTLTAQSLVQLNNDLNNAIARRIDAAKDWNAISALPALSIPQVNQNTAVQSLLQERGRAQGEYDALRAKYMADHPQVRQLRGQVDSLTRQITTLASQIREGLRAPYVGAVEAEEALRARLASIKSQQLREDRDSVQLGILERASQTNRAQYETLLARYNDLNAEAGAPSNNLAMVDQADVPTKPIRPSFTLNLVIALLLGLMLAGLFVIARETLLGRIRSPDDVQRLLGLPLYGVTPDIGADDPQEVLEDRKSPLSEAYAAIRAVLNVSSVRGLPQVLAFTSASPGEGKSVSCYALARATARMGRKVLVIDADLRRPRQHHLAKIANVQGLSNLLSHSASFDELVRHDPNTELDFLVAGPIPPNPVELLAPDNMAPFLDLLRQRYDHIFIDAPPVLGLADAIEVANMSDKTVLLVRSGANSPSVVRKALQRLNMMGPKVGGVILSRFDAKQAGYGTEYGYEYAYS